MTISESQVRTFIVLILIERILNNRIPQHVRDAWNGLASKENCQPFVVDLLMFKSSQQIPEDTEFIKFRDNPNFYDYVTFRELWHEMTKYDFTIAEETDDAGAD